MNAREKVINVKRWLSIVLPMVVFSVNAALCPAAEIIDFDALSAGVQPWDVLSASGVMFTTGNIPNAISVGSEVTLINVDQRFEIFANNDAISPPNFAVALGGGLNDLLMSFTTPVISVTVTSDDFIGEPQDLIRLLALEPTSNPYQFIVLALDEGFDNAISSPDNLLTVDAGGTPFEYALFQTTTEQEGFDDLTFTPIPEPATLLLLGLGGLFLRRKR